MLVKGLILAVVLYVIYLAFFKKQTIKEEKEQKSKKQNDKNSDVMLECAECSTFVSEKEAIIKDGKFYCSKQCAHLR